MQKRYWLSGGIIAIVYTLAVLVTVLFVDKYLFPPEVPTPNFTVGSIIAVLFIPVSLFIDPLRLDVLARKGYVPEWAPFFISALITGVIAGWLYGKIRGRMSLSKS